jgi:hypothetical protein
MLSVRARTLNPVCEINIQAAIRNPAMEWKFPGGDASKLAKSLAQRALQCNTRIAICEHRAYTAFTGPLVGSREVRRQSPA